MASSIGLLGKIANQLINVTQRLGVLTSAIRESAPTAQPQLTSTGQKGAAARSAPSLPGAPAPIGAPTGPTSRFGKTLQQFETPQDDTPDAYGATQGFLASLSPFVPMVGQIAGMMGALRRVGDSWRRMQETSPVGVAARQQGEQQKRIADFRAARAAEDEQELADSKKARWEKEEREYDKRERLEREEREQQDREASAQAVPAFASLPGPTVSPPSAPLSGTGPKVGPGRQTRLDMELKEATRKSNEQVARIREQAAERKERERAAEAEAERDREQADQEKAQHLRQERLRREFQMGDETEAKKAADAQATFARARERADRLDREQQEREQSALPRTPAFSAAGLPPALQAQQRQRGGQWQPYPGPPAGWQTLPPAPAPSKRKTVVVPAPTRTPQDVAQDEATRRPARIPWRHRDSLSGAGALGKYLGAAPPPSRKTVVVPAPTRTPANIAQDEETRLPGQTPWGLPSGLPQPPVLPPRRSGPPQTTAAGLSGLPGSPMLSREPSTTALAPLGLGMTMAERSEASDTQQQLLRSNDKMVQKMESIVEALEANSETNEKLTDELKKSREREKQSQEESTSKSYSGGGRVGPSLSRAVDPARRPGGGTEDKTRAVGEVVKAATAAI